MHPGYHRPTKQSWILRRSEDRSRSRPQQSAWCNIHPSPVKRIRTFTSKHSFNYVKLSTWMGWLKIKWGQGFFSSRYSGRFYNSSTLNPLRRCKIGTRWLRLSWRNTTRRVKLKACVIRKERGSRLEGRSSKIHMRRMWRVRPCPQTLSGGSQSARLHEEGRIAELPLRAR
jgi:hypothetical protein